MANSINSAIKKRLKKIKNKNRLTTDNNSGGQRHLLQLDLFCQTSIFYMEEHGLLLKVAELNFV